MACFDGIYRLPDFIEYRYTGPSDEPPDSEWSARDRTVVGADPD